MKLYIDLKKAVSQMPNTGIDTPLEDQAVEEYETSFARRPVGVAVGEENDPDDPEVGKKWQHDPDDSEVAATKERRKKRTAEAKEEVSKNFFGVMPNDEVQVGVQKGIDILKDLNSRMEDRKVARAPNAREQEFLREVLGYTQEDINKGIAVIAGRNRSLFSKWLCDRLSHSTSDLMKSVGAHIG